MFSTFPTTPGRGRSRFSKDLPTPPVDSLKAPERSLNASSISESVERDLPVLPSEVVKASAVMAIPRRPVGGVGSVQKPVRTASIASVSSVYSDSPGFSQSISDSSTKDSLSEFESETGSKSALPPKDKELGGQDDGPQTANKSPSTSISSLNKYPQRTEIWKRRSLKSEHNIVFPDLQLQRSNGSTAEAPLGREEQATENPQLPRSIAGRRPVPARPPPPQPDFMGNKFSKLRERGSSDTSGKDGGPTRQDPPQQYPPGSRLPTPDYLKTDRQQPATPTVLSPVSPFTPPDDKPPLIPSRSESRSQKIQGSGSDATTIAPIKEPASKIASLSNETLLLTHDHSRNNSDTLTITSQPAVMRSPQPQKPQAAARILTPQPSPGDTSPLSLPSPITQARYFPTVQSAYGQKVDFPTPPLDLLHLDCYQFHKTMRNTRNVKNPVACMVCDRKSTEQVWKCTWCCLSTCGSCMQILATIPERNLRVCLERIGK